MTPTQGRASFVASFTHSSHSIIARLSPETAIPSIAMSRSGMGVKEVMPSKARASILRSGYLDSPANRAARS